MDTARLELADVPYPIEFDIPCKNCDYNLRGLTYPGPCPECGHSVEHSWNAWRVRFLPYPPPDVAWVRKVRGAAWLSIATFALLCAVCISVRADVERYALPYNYAELQRTPLRVFLLSIACVWWVLAWASMWRITTRERIPGRRTSGKFVSPTTRVLNGAHLLSPFAWAWAWATWRDGYIHSEAGWIVCIVLAFSGVAGAFLFMVRVGQALWRLGAPMAAAQAWLLSALGTGVTFLSALTFRDGGRSSLSAMFALPAYPYGVPSVLQQVFRDLTDSEMEPVLLLLLAAPIWSVGVMVWLLVISRAELSRRENAESS